MIVNLKKVRDMFVVTALTCSMITMPILAAPSTSSLQEQKNAAQNEVSSLQSQLNALISTMNELEGQLVTKGQEISKAQEDLQAAQETEAQQYEDMKLRIKYMYEEGDGTALERILSSGSIADLLSEAEYIEKVHTYDRNMLQEYADTVEEIKTLETTLENEMTNLQDLEKQYKSQSAELNTVLSNKQAEVSNLDTMIQEAARAALAEQKKQQEAAAKDKKVVAGKNEAVAQPGTNESQGSGSVAGSDSGSGGGSNTEQPSQDVPEDNNASVGGNTGTPEPNYNASTGNAVVDRAYGWVNNAEYNYGACAPGSFDCSGFVSYCLTGSYSRLGNTMTFLAWPQVSNPQLGDVCVSASHCGIYIGGGQMIHAADYGIGVIVGPVQGGMIYVRY